MDAFADQADQWRVQGKTENLCWIDSDGNEIEHPDVQYPSGDNKTLVVDGEMNVVSDVSQDEMYGFICQMEKPAEGKNHQLNSIFICSY